MNKNKIPFYVMIVLGGYWIIVFFLMIAYPESGIFNNNGFGLIALAIASFYISTGILAIYILRAIILFLTTGQWWK